MCVICTMVSRWCRCEGHLLSGVEATCSVCPRGCWPPTTHSIMLPPTPPWTLYKTFFWGDWLTFVSSQQLKILKTIRYLLIVRKLASGQFPSINLKLIETFKNVMKSNIDVDRSLLFADGGGRFHKKWQSVKISHGPACLLSAVSVPRSFFLQ